MCDTVAGIKSEVQVRPVDCLLKLSKLINQSYKIIGDGQDRALLFYCEILLTNLKACDMCDFLNTRFVILCCACVLISKQSL